MRVVALLSLCLSPLLASRGWSQAAPAPPAEWMQGLSLPDVRAGRACAVVLVRDYMRIRNDGPATDGAEFARYFPRADDRQVVIARWARAATDGGRVVPVSLARVEWDSAENPIHIWRLGELRTGERATMTVTSLVARREPPPPEGSHPILERHAYAPEVRPYLRSSRAVLPDDPRVVTEVERLRARTGDAYELARMLAESLRSLSYNPGDRSLLGTMSLPAFVLDHGGSCCVSAITAASVLRGAGVPAQLLYAAGNGYIHGIVRFYLPSYGWVDADMTCGVGEVPFVREVDNLASVFLYRMPHEAESVEGSWVWPYQHTDADGPHRFVVGGVDSETIGFIGTGGDTPEREARGGEVEAPFPHYEPGTWCLLLGMEHLDGAWADWDRLVAASRAAIGSNDVGVFAAIVAERQRIPAYVQFAEQLP